MLRVMLRVVVLVWVQLYLFAPELMKLPMLVAHYQEHQTFSEELTLSGFLDLHYADHGHEAADHEGHQNLPFHHHHGTALDQCAAKVIGPGSMRPVSFPELTAREATALPLDDDLLAGHQAELLRPPRTQA
jgi:hypothetical protein